MKMIKFLRNKRKKSHDAQKLIEYIKQMDIGMRY